MAGIQQGLIGSLYGAVGDFESIATTTLGADGTYVTFTSIPATYTHLQLRCMMRGAAAGTIDATFFRFNSDTGSNYSWHYLRGDGASVTASSGVSSTYLQGASLPIASGLADAWGVQIVDILDYANTNKNKTLRSLGGTDLNGSGRLELSSGSRLNTAAITTIDVGILGGNVLSGSTIALYGLKG